MTFTWWLVLSGGLTPLALGEMAGRPDSAVQQLFLHVDSEPPEEGSLFLLDGLGPERTR